MDTFGLAHKLIERMDNSGVNTSEIRRAERFHLSIPSNYNLVYNPERIKLPFQNTLIEVFNPEENFTDFLHVKHDQRDADLITIIAFQAKDDYFGCIALGKYKLSPYSNNIGLLKLSETRFGDDAPKEGRDKIEQMIIDLFTYSINQINDPNYEIIITDAPKHLNAKRAKKGKPPIGGHKILQLRAPKHITLNPGTGRSHASPREHSRRGHFRRRNNRLFWVRPCTVSSGPRIEKTYVL
jgi:hypothetical protein